MMKTLKLIPYFSLPIILAAIAMLSLMPPENGIELHNDKIGHLLAYLVLSLNALYFARTGYQLVTLMIGVLSYGLLMELFQSYIPGRDASLADVLANSFGAVTGMVIRLFIRRVQKI